MVPYKPRYITQPKQRVIQPNQLSERLEWWTEGDKMYYTDRADATSYFTTYDLNTRLGTMSDSVSHATTVGFSNLQEEIENLKRQMAELATCYDTYSHSSRAAVGAEDVKATRVNQHRDDEQEITEGLNELLFD